MERVTFTDGQSRVSTLHQALVDKLKADNYIRSPRIEDAFRAVQRHLFLPDVDVDRVYSDAHIVTKRLDGKPLSSSSQPAAMAMMLEQLDLQPGQHVLDIGAGVRYNAALIARAVGRSGQVVTINIDDDIVTGAHEHLEAAGLDRVQSVCSDGGVDYPPGASYDRVIVTVEVTDIAPAWREHLRTGGRLLVPLALTRIESILGLQALIAFDDIGSHLTSVAISNCGFVLLRGAFAASPSAEIVRAVSLGPTRCLRLVVRSIDAEAVYAALTEPSTVRSADASMMLADLWGLRLWLAVHEPCFCELYADDEMASQIHIPCLLAARGEAIATIGLCRQGEVCLPMRWPDQVPSRDDPFDQSRSFGLSVRSFETDDIAVVSASSPAGGRTQLGGKYARGRQDWTPIACSP